MVASHPSSPAQAAGLGEISRPRTRLRVPDLSISLIVQVALMFGAAGLLIASIYSPYWTITLHAPQYPRGLYIDVFVNKMEPYKNVFEVDGLNHYIGMIKLTDAASIEREISVYALPLLALLALAGFFVNGAWRWLLRLPIILYPAIFVADLFGWLYYAGHSLDKTAPMSSSISEFTPRILGNGSIGQFKTNASFDTGLYLAVAAAVIALVVTIWEGWTRHARTR